LEDNADFDNNQLCDECYMLQSHHASPTPTTPEAVAVNLIVN